MSDTHERMTTFIPVVFLGFAGTDTMLPSNGHSFLCNLKFMSLTSF